MLRKRVIDMIDYLLLKMKLKINKHSIYTIFTWHSWRLNESQNIQFSKSRNQNLKCLYSSSNYTILNL